MFIGVAKIVVRFAWQHPVIPGDAGSKSGAGAGVTEGISLLSARLLVKRTLFLATGVIPIRDKRSNFGWIGGMSLERSQVHRS